MTAIRRLRKSSKLSQYELAIEIGTDRSTVTKWETGKAFPRTDKLPHLARLLGCRIEDLYDNETPIR